jgi:hypothetical protein
LNLTVDQSGEAGFHEGRNVAIEFRWANNEPGVLPELATDLVHRRVAFAEQRHRPKKICRATASIFDERAMIIGE